MGTVIHKYITFNTDKTETKLLYLLVVHADKKRSHHPKLFKPDELRTTEPTLWIQYNDKKKNT